MLRYVLLKLAIFSAAPTPLRRKFGLIAKRDKAIRPRFSAARARFSRRTRKTDEFHGA
jgi:hypothetical protein